MDCGLGAKRLGAKRLGAELVIGTGHFGPDPLTPFRMTPVITASFIR